MFCKGLQASIHPRSERRCGEPVLRCGTHWNLNQEVRRRVAARSGSTSRFPVQRWRSLPPCARRSQGVDQVSSRTHGGIGILDHTHLEVDEVGCPRVQNSLAPSPSSPFAPVRPLLPVWPSTRPKWPPPRSLPTCRGVGTAGLPVGERSGTHVPRGRSACLSQRACPSHGPPSSGRR